MIVIHSLEDPRLPLKNTAVALGMFDGMHTGHRAVLDEVVRQGKARGLTPCVFTFALADPPRVKTGAAQLTTPGTLAFLLEELGMEYAIAPAFQELRGRTGEEFVNWFLGEKLGARFVCCGYNFGFGKDRACSAEDLRRLARAAGMDCHVADQVTDSDRGVSSTRIRKDILAGNVAKAAKLLGRPFTIDFPVVHGNRIGRTLGTPTINQPFPHGFAIPRFGVYATLARVDGKVYSGVTNVGMKPTVGSEVPLAETYIQGFSGDLYGRQVQVSFLEFVRPEKRFASLEELRANILRDAETAAAIAEKYLRQEAAKE